MIYIVKSILLTVIRAFELLLVIRAVLSWISVDTGAIGEFIYKVTEPVIEPIRSFLWRFDFFRGLPIDVSFIFAYILIDILRAIIGRI